MIRSCLTLFLLLTVLSAPVRASKDSADVSRWLGRLRSASSMERVQAQRWLASNLRRDDFELLHRAVAAGDPESAGRLVHVLASSERHYELAVLLALDREKPIASVGREALAELASRWSADVEQVGVRRLKVIEELGELSRSRISIQPRAHGLENTLELLSRCAASGVPLVLDPDLLRSRSAPVLDDGVPRVLEGTEAGLLAELSRGYSLGFDGFGLEGTSDMAWVRICRRIREGKKTAVELLVEWSLRVGSGDDPLDAEHCARALAATGWPAALAWLETRWLDRGDRAALAGLRLVASRGAVSPGMRTGETQQVWLEAVNNPATRAEAARALGALGPRSSSGQELESGLLASWDGAGEAGRWARLVALELRRSGGELARSALLETLGSREASAALRYQAVRSAAAIRLELPSGSPVLDGLFEHGMRIDGGRELVEHLLRLGVEFDRAPGSDTWSEAQQLALCEWEFLSGRLDLAGPWLVRVVEEGELGSELRSDPARSTLVLRMREWQQAGFGAELAAWLTELAASTSELDRILIHLGLLTRQAEVELADAWMTEARAGRLASADLQSLAALAAGQRGAEVREVLLAEVSRRDLAGSRKARVEAALDEAVRALRAAREDRQLDAFIQRVRRAGILAYLPPPAGARPRPAVLFSRQFES